MSDIKTSSELSIPRPDLTKPTVGSTDLKTQPINLGSEYPFSPMGNIETSSNPSPIRAKD